MNLTLLMCNSSVGKNRVLIQQQYHNPYQHDMNAILAVKRLVAIVRIVTETGFAVRNVKIGCLDSPC